MKNKSPPQAPKNIINKSPPQAQKKKTRAHDEHISNAKAEAAKCAPRHFWGDCGDPPDFLGSPEKKQPAPTPKICSRTRAGNAVGPPTTSKLYDLSGVSQNEVSFGKKAVHNPYTTPAQAVSRVSQASRVGRAQPFAQAFTSGRWVFPMSVFAQPIPPTLCTSQPGFNKVLSCLEMLRIVLLLTACCVFLSWMSSDFDSPGNPKNKTERQNLETPRSYERHWTNAKLFREWLGLSSEGIMCMRGAHSGGSTR